MNKHSSRSHQQGHCRGTDGDAVDAFLYSDGQLTTNGLGAIGYSIVTPDDSLITGGGEVIKHDVSKDEVEYLAVKRALEIARRDTRLNVVVSYTDRMFTPLEINEIRDPPSDTLTSLATTIKDIGNSFDTWYIESIDAEDNIPCHDLAMTAAATSN
ncbi:reverse transcriptase-like protein [Salinibaculum rarum]|uniref:reverse transcriptase-like protein n=1 Tax=Salinibaculum rarum TaxID=3058903 RepID=UPI00265DCA01|nr:reverse transcriptase-like protein [Salinibaculum sp. KK48]